MATPEGVVKDISVHRQRSSSGVTGNPNGSANGAGGGEDGPQGGERRESGWVPASSNGVEVCHDTAE